MTLDLACPISTTTTRNGAQAEANASTVLVPKVRLLDQITLLVRPCHVPTDDGTHSIADAFRTLCDLFPSRRAYGQRMSSHSYRLEVKLAVSRKTMEQ